MPKCDFNKVAKQLMEIDNHVLMEKNYYFMIFEKLSKHYKIHLSCSRRASSGGLQEVWTPAIFRYSPNCALKFLNQFSRNALKSLFKKRKNPSKPCTNSILLKFFNVTLASAGQKNAELILEKLRLIRNLNSTFLTP